MHKLNNVLVVCNDTQDYALLAAQLGALFGKTRAEVTLMYVVGDAPSCETMSLPPDDLADLITAHYQSSLDGVASTLDENGIDVSITVVTGHPPRRILEETTTGAYDLVVKSVGRHRPRRRPHRLDLWLLRRCPLPLLLLGTNFPGKVRNVMVAIDLVPSLGLSTNNVARNLLEMGKYISQSTAALLHVFHAWRASGESKVRYRLGAAMADQYIADYRVARWRLLTETLSRSNVGASTTHIHFHKGDVRHLLPQAVRDWNIDLLVIGGAGRTGISAHFFGNTSEAILPEIDTSVLAFKPDSFLDVVTDGAGEYGSAGCPSGTATANGHKEEGLRTSLP